MSEEDDAAIEKERPRIWDVGASNFHIPRDFKYSARLPHMI